MVWVATKSGEVISHMLLTLVFFFGCDSPKPHLWKALLAGCLWLLVFGLWIRGNPGFPLFPYSASQSPAQQLTGVSEITVFSQPQPRDPTRPGQGLSTEECVPEHRNFTCASC